MRHEWRGFTPAARSCWRRTAPTTGDHHVDAPDWRLSPLGHGHRRRRRRSLLRAHLYRSAFGSSSPDEECERALAHLEHVIALEGPSTIAALFLESVIGGSGVIPPPPGYLEGVRELCTRHGIVYVADEVLVGFGRTGEWFGVDHARVSPDLMAFAKGVNSGYVPLGGVLVGDTIYDTFVQRPYPGGLTYSGHPLACAAAVGALRAMHDEGLVASAARLGTDVLGPGLRKLAAAHSSVGEVRGIGALWTLELVRDRTTREPLVPYAATGPAAAPMAALGAACLERGLIVFVFGNRINVAPPLNLRDDEAADGLAILDEVLAVAERLRQVASGRRLEPARRLAGSRVASR
jgi:taurine---2-oxoglutarate transaminase